MNFAVPADHRVKLKGKEKKDKYLDLAWGLKKLRNMKATIIPILTGAIDTVIKELVQGTGGLGNNWTSGNYPNYYIIEIGQKTEKSPGDLRRLAVTQSPVKGHQLTLVWKTRKKYNKIKDTNQTILLLFIANNTIETRSLQQSLLQNNVAISYTNYYTKYKIDRIIKFLVKNLLLGSYFKIRKFNRFF